MATVKVVLRKKQNKDGTYPLAIRITKDRRTSFIHLGQHIKETEWDEEHQRVRKSHANSGRLNNFLLTKLAEANNKALEMETNTSAVSSRAVKQKVKQATGARFAAQAELYLSNLQKTGKYNRYSADKPRVKHFKEFLKGEDISLADITESLLNRFKVYLKSTQKVGERTIVNHLVVIRSIFSQAIKESVIERKYYPFGAGKIRIKFPDTLKIGLSPEEVKQLEDVALPHPAQNHARNLWLFSFYFAGMRVSDVLRIKWSDIQNDRLYYSMGKNAKGGSLKMPEKALKIIVQYADQKLKEDDFIFPDLKSLEDLSDKFEMQKRIANTVSRIDRLLRLDIAPLAKIEKKLTMHIARHTFGNISGERIPLQMLQKLYRHTSITTTIGYQSNFIHKDTDSALDAVLTY
ncbi:MAG: integrase family protein [Bacteroidota bacterium]|nr:integrase family protein [Bacteroidota bacterium]